MHLIQVKTEFTKTPKCAELCLPGSFFFHISLKELPYKSAA